MGNTRSTQTVREEDVWWSNGEKQEFNKEEPVKSDLENIACETVEINDREQRKKELEEDFLKFKKELAQKHEQRRELIRERKNEMANLRYELITEKEENQKLKRLLKDRKPVEILHDNVELGVANPIISNPKEENEDLRNELDKLRLMLKEKETLTDKNKELRISLAEMQKELQSVNTQIISFEKERIDYQEHVTALKDIIKVTKEMLRVRESQIEELKKKITSIEELLASKEMSILSDDLRHEYERQLRNIRDLRLLYEERQRVDKREKENLLSQIENLKKNVDDEQTKNGEHKERIDELEADNSKKYDKIVTLESDHGLVKAECKELHAEMEIINQLFSQILISFNNEQDVDLDSMVKTLEQNHDLLTKIVINDESGETSALPKVLLELINQVNENKKDILQNSEEAEEEEVLPQAEKNDKLAVITEEEENQNSGIHQLNSPEEIVENLPKVWKVLIELLSHQSPPNNDITEKKGENDNHCYKSVETPTGSTKVLSVSKTFIRLKNLILEKKSLEKEMTRLKQLNTHLEGRLSDQEKRLVLVSSELSKTWNFVGKMQKQHQQLHTQEKILRYELAQKRKLLTELKGELEYCRQKWSQAREQNSSTEKQWRQLRTEFASRKKTVVDDVNSSSVESGYSDDKSSSDDDDPDFEDKTQGEEQIKEAQSQNELEETISPINDANSVNETTVEVKDPSQVTETVPLDPEMAEIEKLCLDVETSDLLDAEGTNLEVLHSLEVQKTEIDDKCELKRQTDDVQTSTATNNLEETISEETVLVIPETCEIQQNDCEDGKTNTTVDVSSSSQSAEDVNLEQPSTSTKNPTQATAEFVARREERMKRLEEQCNQLFCSVAKTSLRGMAISHKLDNLHEIYGNNSESNNQETESTEVSDNGETQEENNENVIPEGEKAEEENVRPNVDSTNENNQE